MRTSNVTLGCVVYNNIIVSQFYSCIERNIRLWVCQNWRM